MQVTKIEAGEYQVLKDSVVYLVSKDSYTGGWSVHCDGKYITYKNTKKECLDFIERGYTVKILDSISIVPPVELDTHFVEKSNRSRVWSVDDVIYSSKLGRWRVKGSYYKDSVDEGRYTWDYDDFEEDCEITTDGCWRSF